MVVEDGYNSSSLIPVVERTYGALSLLCFLIGTFGNVIAFR